MPLYEYECDACGQRFEVIQKFSDAPLEVCRKCGKGPIRKLMSSPAIQFKGTGWYITDYAKKGQVASATTDGGSDKNKGGADKETSAGEKKETASPPASSSGPATPAKKSD